MRRFYKVAGMADTEGGCLIQLDGRPVNTPAKTRLVVPSAALAQAIAEEWNAQGETVEPATMPLTQLANTAIDRVAGDREGVLCSVLAYAESDLLCYRADQPAELEARQNAIWQPLLDWAALEFDAPLTVTRGVLPISQPRSSVEALRAVLSGLDDLHLAAVGHATGLSGSIVVGLALAAGRVTAEQAFEAANIDEAYQRERWGADAEATARLEHLRREIAATDRFLKLLDG